MKYEPATIRPQYDAFGGDSGLWILFDNDGPVYEGLTLFMKGNELIVGQYPEWDGESYNVTGTIDAEHKELGKLVCPNPYEDDDAASYLYEWLKKSDAVEV